MLQAVGLAVEVLGSSGGGSQPHRGPVLPGVRAHNPMDDFLPALQRGQVLRRSFVAL